MNKIEEIDKNIEENDNKILNSLEEKFGDQFFSYSYLFNKKDVELHKEIFDKFHYIFSLKEEGKTYLWNHFVSKKYYEKEFEKEEFTKEELAFLKISRI